MMQTRSIKQLEIALHTAKKNIDLAHQQYTRTGNPEALARMYKQNEHAQQLLQLIDEVHTNETTCFYH